MSKATIKAIVACDPNGVIAVDGKIPWPNISRDMRMFRTLTKGQAVVMGRETWNSLGRRTLDRRLNIVLSASPGRVAPPPMMASPYSTKAACVLPAGFGLNLAISPDIQSAVTFAGEHAQYKQSDFILWAIGGERVYREVIHPNATYPAEEVYLTRMIQRVTTNVSNRVVNTFFPLDLLEENYELREFEYHKEPDAGPRMCFERWARKFKS
jgi:dihydrofolate reductase